jgi:hypothetical protein
MPDKSPEKVQPDARLPDLLECQLREHGYQVLSIAT